jgi:hypothetical protein
MEIVVREFQSLGEEMKKVVLKVVYQCLSLECCINRRQEYVRLTPDQALR